MKRLLIAFALLQAAFPQAAQQANEHYQTREGREQVARGLASAQRAEWQKPQELVDSLHIRQGMAVADIGTGVGFMLPYLSRAAGPSGKVVAEDIFPDFLEKASQNAQKEGLTNVSFVKGTATDPNLPKDTLDLVLALETYHHWDYFDKTLAGVRESLRPGGRFVVVDYHRRPGAMKGGDAMHHIRADQPQVIREIESAGFRLVSKRDHLPNSQYVLEFISDH